MKLISTLCFSLVLLLGLVASVNAQTTKWQIRLDEANKLSRAGHYIDAGLLIRECYNNAITDDQKASCHISWAIREACDSNYVSAESQLKGALEIRTRIYGTNSSEVASIQRLLKENEPMMQKTIRMQQAKINDDHQIIVSPAADRPTASKVSLPNNSATTNIVKCFTSDGVKMVEYDASAMGKIIHFERGKLATETERGFEVYGTMDGIGKKLLDSSIINQLTSFSRGHADIGGHSPDKYVSYEFLNKLRSPEEVIQDARIKKKKEDMELRERQASAIRSEIDDQNDQINFLKEKQSIIQNQLNFGQ